MSTTTEAPQTAVAQTVFACTHIEKNVTVDSYKNGCETTCTCTMFESVNIESDSFSGLIAAIGKTYCLEIDSVFTPEDDNGELTHVDFNRLEDADGDEPTDGDIASWKMGKKKLWLADYSFAVEVRTVRALTLADVKASGVKHHG